MAQGSIEVNSTTSAVDNTAAGSLNRLISDKRPSWFALAKFSLVRNFLGTWARLFGLRGLYWFGSAFAAVEFLINHKRRQKYRKALERVFPEGIDPHRANQIIRRYFRRTRCDKLFYLVYDQLPRHKVLSRIRFHGRDHVDRGLAAGRGVYMAMSHHGSHHVLGMLLSLLGYRITGIRDRQEGALRSFIQSLVGPTVPEFPNVQMIYADDFPREIFRCFRENRLVVSALDVNRDRGSKLKTCQVQFFGEQRTFLTGTMQLAQRMGAVIVPTFWSHARIFTTA
jgi:lauroyl/myristoyl acyltransferase